MEEHITTVPQLTVLEEDGFWNWCLSVQNGVTIRGWGYYSEAAAWDNGRVFREAQMKNYS